MTSTLNTTPRSKVLPVAVVVTLVAIIVAGAIWFSLGNDDEASGSGADPFRNAVSDKRAPAVAVTVRDDGGQPVAELAYNTSAGPIPTRATTVYLQAQDRKIWSTTHSLSTNPLNEDGDKIIEGVATEVADDAAAGPGPDVYPLPDDLSPDTTYRICVSFLVGHRTDATGCSAPFHTTMR